MKRQTHMDLFVYGTLKKDLRLHGLLEQQKFLGDFTTPPQYDITDYAHGIFPIVYRKENGFKIRGELYSVHPAQYEYIFLMERGAGYVPEPVLLEPNGVQATMFIYQGEPNDEWLSDENVSIKDNTKEWRN
mgnify:CR=1 FL=1|jgi:gamma-glutamylcyclotransferase (GGCT)/AIG2-like uncharacterized protein YtfP